MLIGRKKGRGFNGLAVPLLGLLMAALSPALPAPLKPLGELIRSFTDLDGDLHPDSIRYSLRGAEGRGYLYTVEFEMSAKRRSPAIGVHADDAWGLQFVARDVDGDHDLDLVVTSGSHGRAVDVWLNDGHGGFTSGGVMSFPLSIWLPEANLIAPAPLPIRDAAWIRAGDGSTALIPATAAHPLKPGNALPLPAAAIRADSLQIRNAGPRAPPAA